MAKLQVEALVIDDSFINYCYKKDDNDIAYWESYIEMWPEEYKTIQEATRLVLGLTAAMQQVSYKNTIARESDKLLKLSVRSKWFIAAAAMAGIIALAIISQLLFTHNAAKNAARIYLYTTKNAQQKKLVLPDGSRVTLNAGSFLKISEDFGNKNRNVYLDGEAMFDVEHNAALPFIVHTAYYNVKDLGTLFNVKAYRNEKSSETSLLKGKVEIIMADNKKIALAPNNKIIFSINKPDIIKQTVPGMPDSIISMKPVTFDSNTNTIVETAWTQGELEIDNETFEQIKNQLERWYDVTITFADNEVANYAFTATFKDETIEKVLQALQYSYHFNYKIDGKNITISK